MGDLPGKDSKAYYRCSNLTATSSVVWFKLLTIRESIEGRVNRTGDRGEVLKIDRDLYLVEDVLGRELFLQLDSKVEKVESVLVGDEVLAHAASLIKR